MPVKAPIAAPPAFSWSGCYVGAHWGWGWGKDKGRGFTGRRGSFTSSGSFDNTVSGPLFGGQLGCNYQWPSTNFVVGIEGSYSAADINGFGNQFAGDSGQFIRSKIDGLASVTGRLGWNGWDPMVLFYVKGGWAWAHQRNHFHFSDDSSDRKYGRTGWTIGGGAEWAFSFAPRWSGFVEYMHYDFGNKTISISSDFSGGLFSRTKLNVDTVKIGVNYKFLNPF
jgi:outer membrane immunogenic protein